MPPFEGGQWSAMAAESDGSRFYLRCAGKKDDKDWAFIMAVDPVTGKPLWNLGAPTNPNNGPPGTPSPMAASTSCAATPRAPAGPRPWPR